MERDSSGHDITDIGWYSCWSLRFWIGFDRFEVKSELFIITSINFEASAT